MTYEQIQNYPVGTVYNTIINEYSTGGYWYNNNDRILISEDKTLTDLHFYNDNTFTAIRESKTEEKIDGWIFDGEEWYCAELTWDGFQIILDEDIIK